MPSIPTALPLRQVLVVVVGSLGVLTGPVWSGEIGVSQLEGVQVFTLKQGTTTARFAPSAGANLFSIEADGVEYFRQPESLSKLPGVGYGNPVLYPTPNRVKDARFTFAGREVRFKPNAGDNFIHGLVNRHAWQLVRSAADAESAAVTCVADFREGTELHSLFPFSHQLFLEVKVRSNSVTWTYEVDNSGGTEAVPFGFALHPYWLYQGTREQTFLTIPATHWMEANAQLPSGKLVPADELDFPLGKPFSLAGTSFDDVFWGMSSSRPTRIEFRDKQRRVSIHATADFTHLVVWTPDRPYFGIESQTCSTDAHNLAAQGMEAAAHLQICPPGEKRSGSVEYRIAANE